MNLPPSLSVKSGHLHIGRQDTVSLAARFGTPLYVTDEDRIRARYREVHAALSSRYGRVRVLYAAKANGNPAILAALADEGAGADVFSAGELLLALRAGMDPDRLLFNGSSKSTADLALAVGEGVRVSVDSLDELHQLDHAAREAGRTAEISFRVNPALEVPTHPKIATGLRTSKFGIPANDILAAYREALGCSHVKPVGIHCHIGSQILEVDPFARAAGVMTDLAAGISDLGVRLVFVDLGGGLGIPYRHGTDAAPSFYDYAAAVVPVFLAGVRKAGISPELWVEPGRYLVADSTILLTRVNSVKEAHRRFVNVDAGFNLLVRPVMYGSYHGIVVANKADQPPAHRYTIAGPICETGDLLAEDRDLPAVGAGDLVAVLDAGAYGFAMSSQYNGRPRCAEVLVRGEDAAPMRRAETLDDLTAATERPPWQAPR
ncbi:MAG TPA: diaminopimelate decarboxylase [Methanomicrobiales archaeon]|nr:diaminopimelate decarboxylase [Methanomicrobiales archaeon]